MVAKISKGGSLHGALSYNEEKVKANEAKVLCSNRVMLNRDGSSNMYLTNQSFAPYLHANQNTEKPVLHISINPHPDDEVSDEMYSEIAQTYLDEMGFGDQPYIVYKHEDLDRRHIHIVTVNVDETGKKIDDSNNFYQSKKITRELEKTYNLHTAEKAKRTDNLPQLKPIDYSLGDVKKQISNTTKALMKSYRFQSVNEYRALLSLYGLTVEEVKGELKGKAYNGLVYSAIDVQGVKVGNPIKASAIGKSVGYEALQSRFEYSTKSMKENKVYDSPKLIVRSAIDTYFDKNKFMSELAKNGMSVVFRENAEGRIYGATFIDHQSKAVFNGSKMGKEFSANVFNELFKNETNTQQQNIHTNNNDFQKKEQHTSQKPYVEYEDSSSISVGLLEQHGVDYSAENFARQKEAEEKRKRRMRYRNF